MNELKKIIVLGGGTAGLVTALSLKIKYPAVNISIIKSSDIGIIGVGEGSTEHWDEFMRFVGIDHLELINKTDATVKIGILFKDWNLNSEYVHSVGQHSLSGLSRPESFNQLLLKNSHSKFPLSPEFEIINYQNKVTLTPNLKPSNQYHFDTFKLNNFLIELCKNNSINIIDGVVAEVIKRESGYISAVRLDDESLHEAELYVDCSGFRRVLSSQLGCKWISYKDKLPLNRAIAFPTEFDNPDNIEPYTTATSLSAGWVWKIPTQTRYGNGYVFCDEYISSEKALEEVNTHLNKNVEKVARDIKFEAGKIDKFWKNNVVSIGLAGSFAEPLEAQSIGFTILQARALINYLDVWVYDKNISDVYNKKMDDAFDNIINYLQMHYICKKNDSSFWADKPYKITEFNSHVLNLAENGIVDQSMFEGSYHMFRVANWYQVLAGLRLINTQKLAHQLTKNRQQYNEFYEKDTLNILRSVKTEYRVINHRDYLNLVKFNHEHFNENRNTFFTLG